MNDIYNEVKSIGNTRIINYKYLGPTCKKGARVKLIDMWFETSVIIPFSHLHTTSAETAMQFLIEEGWKVIGRNSISNIIIIDGCDSKRLVPYSQREYSGK